MRKGEEEESLALVLEAWSRIEAYVVDGKQIFVCSALV
jgi:hypothetical protein